MKTFVIVALLSIPTYSLERDVFSFKNWERTTPQINKKRKFNIDSINLYFYNYRFIDTVHTYICSYIYIKNMAIKDNSIIKIKNRHKLDSISDLLNNIKFVQTLLKDTVRCFPEGFKNREKKRNHEITDYYEVYTDMGMLRIGLFRPISIRPSNKAYNFFIECNRVTENKNNHLLLSILQKCKDKPLLE